MYVGILLASILLFGFEYGSCMSNENNSSSTDSDTDDAIGYFFDPSSFTTRIYNGKVSNIKRRPFQVFLNSLDRGISCGGSIIAPSWILTAAHCIYGTRDVFVRAGSTDRRSGGVVRKAKKLIYHEKYNHIRHFNDIGLIKINPLKYSKEIRPIRLPKSDKKAMPKEFVASGWGYTEKSNHRLVNQLHEVKVSLFDIKQCKHKVSVTSVTTNMICAGTGDGRDSCQGDSGGPLTAKKTLYGVVSFGGGCGIKPGVFVNVAKYLDWIKNTMATL